MSLYSRNYGSWTSKGSGSAASDKPSSVSSLERSSRYGSASSINSGGSSSGLKTPSPGPSSYRSLSSVRDRAAQPEPQQPDKPSIREKYASRTYGVEPEQKIEATPSYKRYGSAYSPTSETPSLRFGSSSRFGGQIARSPISEKSPTVFGVSGYTRPSKEDEKKKSEPTAATEMMTLVTRGTSPTPPSNSTFLRARRAEMDRTLEKTVPRLAPRHTTYSVECQTDEKYIEDAKLESKLSAANALTARTPSSSSAYSRFSLTSKYTPRTSAYHGTRSTELTSPTNSVSRTYTSHDDVKTEPSPTKEEKSKKLEGKDTTRIGGFSYARPTDLPVALNKAMADGDSKSDGLVSPSKIRSISPQTPTSMARSIKRDLGNLSSEPANKPYRSSLSRANSASETNEDTHSIKNESPTPSVSVTSSTKASLSPSKSSAKLTSPDRCKLPPPSPKLELSKNIPNKDFRKSELNMNLSSSNESINSQKLKSQRPTDQKSLERSPSAKLSKSPVGLATSKSLAKLPSSSSTSKSVQSIDKPLSTLLRPAMKKESSESSSEDSSSTESSSSSETEISESDNDEHTQAKSNALSSAVAGSKLSLTSSRTSAQLSSADEASVSTDKPPRPPSSLRVNKAPEDQRTEEAKAVVVKALTPVAGVMKVMYHGSVDESSDKDNKPSVSLTGKLEKSVSRASVGSTSNLEKSGSKSSLGSDKSGFKIQHTTSEERLLVSEGLGKKDINRSDSEKGDPKIDLQAKENDVIFSTITGKVQRNGSRTSLGNVSKLEKSGSKSSLGSTTSILKMPNTQSGETARLMSSPSDIMDKKTTDKSESEKDYVKVQLQNQEKVSDQESGAITSRVGKLEKSSSRKSLDGAPKCEKSSSKSSLGGEKKNFKIQHIQSGERAWWLGPPSEEVNNKKLDKSDKEGNKELLDSDDNPNIPGSPSLREGNKSTSASENEMKPPIPQRLYKLKKAESGSSSDVPGVEKSPSSKSIRKDKSKSSLYRIKRIESGERPWWLQESEGEDNTSSGIQDMPSDSQSIKEIEDVRVFETTQSSPVLQKKPYTITKIESGERAWWLGDGDDSNKESHKKVVSTESPGIGQSLQDSLVENSAQGKTSPYENPYKITKIESGERAWWLGDESKKDPPPPPKSSTLTKRPKNLPLFIGRHTNIDDVLGTQAPPPAAFRTPQNSSDESDTDSEEIFEVKADDVKIHDSTAMMSSISRPNGMIKLDDTALQLYKEGDYGSYLDLDASINEQQEEFENFQSNRKNSIVLRTQLSVRVHTIIEKLMSSEGRELRRALFSLKQIFQEDKDLVHEFVQNDGLSCLIKVGSDADQNYQNYILRALGQVMLYVDGMNGVMEHSPTVQWLYSLVSSRFRLVVKTALKLLLVFVEYVETNSVLLVKAIQAVDGPQGVPLWSNVMRLMKEYDAADTELLIYATSLVNKTLNGLPDQDTYYDQVDALEEQGLEHIIRRYMSKQGTDLDLLRQFQIYEAVLQHEDGDHKGAPLKQLDETIRKTIRHRKCLTSTLNPIERRKSRRHSTGTSPLHLTLSLSRSNDLDPGSQTDEYHNVADDGGVGVTPALRRRRERAERQRSFLREQREATLRASLSSTDQSGSEDGGIHNGFCNGDSNQARRENTVKDLTQKLASTLGSPVLDADGKPMPRVGDMKGIISKAKEGLAKSQSRGDVLKSPTTETPPVIKPPEVKKTETELHWEELVNSCTRSLALCDLDFTDLQSDDEQSVLAPTCMAGGVPPPPPPCAIPPPIPAPAAPAAPPPLATMTPNQLASPLCKNKKTVKLFWKEVRDDPVVFAKLNSNSLIWDEMSPVTVDIQKLEHLFESRAKDLITKKQQEMNKNKEVIVLDPKRSNAINIGMTKLPPPRSIKTAILKMDATIMNREGIEKLLTMLPTEEERSKIQEAQAANPDLPLGSAEQFLLTLASISELAARLKLWAFKLDFENSEKEIAEPLMDLKQGIETLRVNKTFRGVLGTLLSIGIFLNGNEVKGFQIEYLAKVPEVKDTVHKHSLLHHLCHMVMEKFPDSTDLYSEIGAVTRASKVDFDELTTNIVRLETECKASFDHLKEITKHDGSCTNMKVKMSDFLVDCAEHIIVLGKVHKRVMNRYFKFCLWLGIPYHRVQATKPNELCRIISEFALEYRTTRERVMQQLEKKASHRERNKTRGKMITEVGKFRTQDDRADAELRQLLGNDSPDNESTLTGSLPWRRQRKDIVGRASLGNVRNDGTNGNLTDADDEILESLVKTATKIPATRTAPRERKRTRHADRKSLRRTLRNGLSEEERKHLATFIKGY